LYNDDDPATCARNHHNQYTVPSKLRLDRHEWLPPHQIMARSSPDHGSAKDVPDHGSAKDVPDHGGAKDVPDHGSAKDVLSDRCCTVQ
jgi:hypothetical protein